MTQNPKHLVLLLLLSAICRFGSAQTLTTNPEDWNTLVPGGVCNGCNITIPTGYTLNLNSAGECTGCTFTSDGVINVTAGFTFDGSSTSINGGEIDLNASATFSGTTSISGTNIVANAPTTFNNASFAYDSLQANSNLTFSTGTNTISGCNIEVATGVALNMSSPDFSAGSAIAFAGNSSMTTTGSLIVDGSSVYLNGTSSITSTNSTTIQNGSTIALLGSGNNFSANNLGTVVNSSILLTNAATMSSNTLSTLGGSFTESGSASYTSAGSISLGSVVGTTVSMSNTSRLTGSQVTVAKGSLTMNNSAAISTTGTISLTSSTVTMNSQSSMSGAAATISGGTFTMNDTTNITTGNFVTFTGPTTTSGVNARLNSNASIVSGGTLTVQHGSNVTVGGGSAVATAHIYAYNGLNIPDGNSVINLSNQNNYFQANGTVAGNSNNCGIALGYANNCSANTAYGCATINSTGTTPCTVLAVDDIQLTATIGGPTQVDLSFTDDEAGSATQYLVQRQPATGGQWSTIATIPAGGYTVGQYRYTDGDAPTGTINYRIARMSQNNTTKFSTISSVTLGSNTTQVSIRPNPVTNGTIYITSPFTSQILVNVYTITGQLLQRYNVAGKSEYIINLPGSALAANSIVIETIGQAGTQTFTLLIR